MLAVSPETRILPAFAVTQNHSLVASDLMPYIRDLKVNVYVSYMIVLRCIDNLKKILLWKWTFDLCDPKWPQIDPSDHKWLEIQIWAYNLCRGYLADEYAWVTGPYHVICRRKSIFGENDPFLPVTATWSLTPSWSCHKCAFIHLLLWPKLVKIGCSMSEILTCWQKEEEEERITSCALQGHEVS